MKQIRFFMIVCLLSLQLLLRIDLFTYRTIGKGKIRHEMKIYFRKFLAAMRCGFPVFD